MDRGTWDEAYAERYDEWSAHMTADVPFYVDLAREADGPIVELAVGNGRVAIPVARATGRRVIGIDRSPAMLAQARTAAAEVGIELDLRLADMRDFALDELAALIYCPFRSLLHLPAWADRRIVFEHVAASLTPGGRFAWNAFVFEHVAASLTPGGRFAWNAFVFDHRYAARADGVRVDGPMPHTVRYTAPENRLDIVMDNGATSSLWWATKNEWLGLIDVAGLELESLYGGFSGEPFGEESREYVFVARRPGGPT